MYYITCFFIYSFLGYLFESFVSLFRSKKFSSGILYGPWTPIYGIGVDFILVISNLIFRNLHIAKWRELMFVFFTVIFVLTFIEWLGGVIIEKFFHVVFWNYEDFSHHIGKYIALEVSLFWGILSFILIYIIHPFIYSFIIKIPNAIVYFLILFMFFDYYLTIKKYLKSR